MWSRTAARPATLVALLLWIVLPGCLARTLTVETRPPGARVLMDRVDVGTTPLTLDFSYGGRREFLILHEEGDQLYRPLRVIQDTESFFCDTFPFDVLVDIAPTTIRDDHVLSFDLEPSNPLLFLDAKPEAFTGALLRRAHDLRERARVIQEQAPPPLPPLLEPAPATPEAEPPTPEAEPAPGGNG